MANRSWGSGRENFKIIPHFGEVCSFPRPNPSRHDECCTEFPFRAFVGCPSFDRPQFYAGDLLWSDVADTILLNAPGRVSCPILAHICHTPEEKEGCGRSNQP